MILLPKLRNWLLSLQNSRIGSILFGPTHCAFLQIPRALVASVIAAGVDFAVLVLLVEGAGWHPIWAAILSYLLGGLVQYVFCSVWVFPEAPQSVMVGFTVFTLLSLVGLAITVATMWILYTQWRLHYVFAKIVALGLSFCWNFTSRKYLLFQGRQKSQSSAGQEPLEPKHIIHES